MGRADSRLVPRVRHYSRTLLESLTFRIRGCHPLWPGLPSCSTKLGISNSMARPQPCPQLSQPPSCNARGLDTRQVWARPFSLAATGGVDVSFLSCRYLDGSVPCVTHGRLCIHRPLTRESLVSFPNLGYPRIIARLRLPGAFRSLATSFVGSWCLGILTYTLSSLT